MYRPVGLLATKIFVDGTSFFYFIIAYLQSNLATIE
jgi:hypothetical protein